MEKRVRIADTDLSVSAIGLGTAMAGIHWDGTEADRIFDAFLDAGGNLIDTARVYSDWIPPEIGRSERVLGDWFRREKKRGRVVLVTKGGHPEARGPGADVHVSRMTENDMRHDVEASLKAMGVDTIDVYLYHRDDRTQSVEEEIETMEKLRREGKIRYYGCSNWDADRIAAADGYARRMGYRGFVCDEALLNAGVKYMKPPADDTLRAIRGDLRDYHVKNERILAIAFTSVAGGFFHRFLSGGPQAVSGSPYCTEGNVRIAGRIRDLTRRYDVTVTQLLLAFLWVQPFPCVPLFGPHGMEQLQDAMKAWDTAIPPEELERLL